MSAVIVALAAMATDTAYAQDGTTTVNNIAILKDIEGYDIYGDAIYCPAGIKKSESINRNNYIFFLDKKGITHIYDTKTLKEKAKTKIKGTIQYINDDGYIVQEKTGFFKGSNTETSFYNFDNEELWKCDYLMVCLTHGEKVCICYRDNMKNATFQTLRKSLPEGKLIGFDVHTGKELWKTDIPHEYHFPWSSCYSINTDNSEYIYLMGDSLCRLNTTTGETKSIVFDAGVDEPMPMFRSGFRNLANYYWDMEKIHSRPPFIKSGIKAGTHSNIIEKGNYLYAADANDVFCLTRDLNIVWKTHIPEEMASKSQIELYGDTLVMQNYGIAFTGNGAANGNSAMKCGVPFTAAYDAKTGKQLYLNVHNLDVKLIGGTVTNGRYYWQDAKGFFYNDFGEKEIKRIDWKLPTIKIAKVTPDTRKRIIKSKIFFINGNSIDSLCTDKRHLVMSQYDNKVYVIYSDGHYECLDNKDCYYKVTNNLYCSLTDDNYRYVKTRKSDGKIDYRFEIDSDIAAKENGDIIIMMKDGIGIIRNR